MLGNVFVLRPRDSFSESSEPLGLCFCQNAALDGFFGYGTLLALSVVLRNSLQITSLNTNKSEH